jgi:uncharacterized membrane protein
LSIVIVSFVGSVATVVSDTPSAASFQTVVRPELIRFFETAQGATSGATENYSTGSKAVEIQGFGRGFTRWHPLGGLINLGVAGFQCPPRSPRQAQRS